MAEPTDPDPTHPPLRQRRIWPFLLIPLLVIGAFLLVYRIVNEPRGAEGTPTVLLAQELELPKLFDGGQLVSVDEGDRQLRELAAGWSADPIVARWLNVMSLRHLVAAAQLMAEGENVKPAVPFISIPGQFAVREEGDRLFIAQASYARYDVLMRVVGSIDAAAAGDAYVKLQPFIESAFAEIGRPGTAFGDVLSKAVRRVVQVKLLDGEVELVPKGAVYGFKDPEVEKLTSGEKQVLRMGPKHGALLQRQLRTFAEHARVNIDS